MVLRGDATIDEEIMDLITWEDPVCILQLNMHTGVLRMPCVTLLHGEPHDVTFCEDGIIYTLNQGKIMF